VSKKKTKTVLVISDLQYPFAHKDSLAFLKAVNRKYKCNEVVCIGDEVDMHAISDWGHVPPQNNDTQHIILLTAPKRCLACQP